MKAGELIDTHAHVYVENYGEGVGEMLNRAQAAGVARICMPNIDLASVPQMYAVADAYPWCHPMMGLHPCSVTMDWQEVLDEMESLLDKRSHIAIGETGLDYHWDLTYKAEQIAALERQISWSREMDLPIVLHTREALDDTIALIRKHQDGRLRGVFHCYGESREQLDQIKDLGFYVGLGGVLTYKKVLLREELQEDDLDYIVLETDSPYLSPMPHRGKQNEPSYMVHVLEVLAAALDMDRATVADRTSQNAMDLYPRLGELIRSTQAEG